MKWFRWRIIKIKSINIEWRLRDSFWGRRSEIYDAMRDCSVERKIRSFKLGFEEGRVRAWLKDKVNLRLSFSRTCWVKNPKYSTLLR